MATFSKSVRKELWQMCNGRCPKCGAKMQIKNCKDEKTYMTIDHIVPRSKNGTNNIGNLRPLCRKCNMDRGNIDLDNILVYRDINGAFRVC